MRRNITAISTVAALLLGSSAAVAQVEALEGDIELEGSKDFTRDGYPVAARAGDPHRSG